MTDTRPAAKPAKKAAAKPPLPTDHSELVAIAVRRGIPSYKAWAMSVPELTKSLEAR